ncbi:MAG: PCMD domain-containing protein [Bacteroidales bacterium]|nr:PCMD domain-containing protein [Bacteroidales bacterium]
MNHLRQIFLTFSFTLLAVSSDLCAQTLIPFGDFEEWVTREMKESGILGGKTRTMYNIGPEETIIGAKPYWSDKCYWGTSNAFAQVVGVTKVNTNVFPDKSHDGSGCARLETVIAECRALGMFDIRVLAGGSIFIGRCVEPIPNTNNPYGNFDWGMPYTKRASALFLDYKLKLSESGIIHESDGLKLSTHQGKDPAEIVVLLQSRKEDEKGNIVSSRVAAARVLLEESTNGWVIKKRVPLIYGSDQYNDPLLCNWQQETYARNSKGKIVKIKENISSTGQEPITHLVLKITSSSNGVWAGTVGNTFWIDNVAIED